VKIVAAPDGVVTRIDRAIWYTTPFDISWRAASTPLDIHEALAAFLQGNAALASAFGSSGSSDIRFWANAAPDGTGWPYAVITNPDEQADGYQTVDAAGVHDYFTHPEFQISIFAEGPGAKDSGIVLGWDVFAALQDVALVFQLGTLLYFRQTNEHSDKDPDKGPLGMDVWQRALFYQATVERTF